MENYCLRPFVLSVKEHRLKGCTRATRSTIEIAEWVTQHLYVYSLPEGDSRRLGVKRKTTPTFYLFPIHDKETKNKERKCDLTNKECVYLRIRR